MRRGLTVVLVLALIAGAAAAGWWAASVALEPPEDPLVGSAPVTFEVGLGDVGRTLQFSAVAEWELEPVGVGAVSGVVTTVDVDAASVVGVGDVLFTVGLRPVVVAEGSVPSFRDLSLRAAGSDVVQLQGLLSALGHYDGEPDGVFGVGVRTAVKAWQEELGVAADGVVRSGDIVYVPSLPTRAVLGDDVVVGSRLSGGEWLVLLVPDAPVFWVPLSIEQRNLVPLSADVDVAYADGVWSARVVAAVEGEFGQLDLVLEGASSSAVCGDVCAQWVGLSGRTDFLSRIVVEPQIEGPVVPSAALGTAADGTPFVTLQDGTVVPVAILGSSDGLAVVEGVSVGDVVLLPFERPEE